MCAWDEGAVRAAGALLHAGGVTVRLRAPGLAGADDDGEELGLASPVFHEVALGRGVFRNAKNARVLLIAASAVDQAAAAGGTASVEAMFAGAAGVAIGDALYRIESWDAMRAGDAVYAYALTLAARAM